ncbi:MAG: anti-sigma factor [Acidobacteriaceae bacterium]
MTERHPNPEDFDLYAFGALDGEDKVTFEAHVRSCADCQKSLQDARRVASLLGLVEAPVTPRPSVKEALMKQIGRESAERKKQMARVLPRKASWSLRFSLGFAFAAAAMAFAASFFWKEDQWQRQEIKALQAQIYSTQAQVNHDAAALKTMNAVVGAADTVQVALVQQSITMPGQAHVLFNARMGVVVYSGEVAPAPAGRSYQLWLVPSAGAPVSAGLVAADQQGQSVVVHLKPGMTAKAFAVTLEPYGGRPQPTGPKVLVGALNG